MTYSDLFAQNYGYYGKKNLVDFQVSMYMPLILKLDTGLDNPIYKADGEKVVDARHNIELAYAITYFRSLTKKVSIGLECGYQRLDTRTPANLNRYNGSDYESMYGKIERFQFNHFSFVPKFEFSKNDGIFGMGIKHQLGFGFAKTTFIDKDYATELYLNQEIGWDEYYILLNENQKEEFRTNMFNFSQKKFKNYILFYALNFRKPLSKSLFLNYGFRYTLNFKNRADGFYTEYKNYWVKNSYIQNAIELDRLYNIISFRLGLSFAF